MLKTAKIFQHGNSQAVRLPKEFRFDEEEVAVKRHAGGILLLPMRYTFEDLISVVNDFQGVVERGEDTKPQVRKF